MDHQQATDALGRQFTGTAGYPAQQQAGFAHVTPQATREAALKVRQNARGVAPERLIHSARGHIMDARIARASGDTRAAHYALRAATADRGAAMDALGIPASSRVFQRPNHWSYGDVRATRRLP